MCIIACFSAGVFVGQGVYAFVAGWKVAWVTEEAECTLFPQIKEDSWTAGIHIGKAVLRVCPGYYCNLVFCDA